MNIALSTQRVTEVRADVLGIACHEDNLGEDPAVDEIDRATGGLLRKAIAQEKFRGKVGQTLSLHTHGKLLAARVALIGIGPRVSFGPAAARVAGGRLARLGDAAGAASVGLRLPVPPDAAEAAAQAGAEGVLLGAYRFDKYLSDDKRSPSAIESATLLCGIPSADGAVARARSTAGAVARARDLVNEQASVMTPSRMAEVAQDLARASGLEVTVLDRTACEKRGMGMYLAVSRGSAEEPRFIHLAWKPAGAKNRVVLVGKGVTFDSGGLSLKPNDAMLDMKVDMSGAAAVISAIAAVATEKLPVEVHALAACTENMPGGRAYKLGDVLRSMAGKTVEINNTDAEGRLTLGDAITYAQELRPDAILDFATLTGACVVALGPHTAGVMTNNEALREAWLAAAKAAGEDMWPLPLNERLMDQLKSEVADMKNTGERWGGALTAGLFLKEFAGSTPWVHTDIAGPATADKEYGHQAKGATGFAVATILEYLRGLAPSIR